MPTTSLGHISIIFFFINSTKSLLYTIPHKVLNFLWGSNFLKGLPSSSTNALLLLYYTLPPLLSGPVVLNCISLLQMHPLVEVVLGIS